MKLNFCELLTILFISFVFNSNGQSSTVSGGGSLKSSGGSITYSLGVTNYIETKNSSLSISQGMQSPFEIFLVSKVNTRDNYLVYPNPTNDVSFIIEKNFDGESISYEVVDINGRVIEKNISKSNKTKISLEKYQSGFYFLQILKRGKKITTFKIIKF